MKPLNTYLNENIYSNLGIDSSIDNETINDWIAIYNAALKNNPWFILRNDNGVITNNSCYMIITDPQLLEDGHLPKLNFKLKTNDYLAISIRCPEFRSFENLPEVNRLCINIDADDITELKELDFSTIKNCKYLDITIYGNTGLKSIGKISQKINLLKLINVDNTPALLDSMSGNVFAVCNKKLSTNGLYIAYDFTKNPADNKSLNDFFKKNRFSRSVILNFEQSKITDFSWFDSLKCKIEKLYISCPVVGTDGKVPLDFNYYDDIIKNSDKFIEHCFYISFDSLVFDTIKITPDQSSVKKFLSEFNTEMKNQNNNLRVVQH